jgi:dTDP-4-dehydrorhamnose 3,5-epimerase
MTGGTLDTYIAQPTTMVHDLNYAKKRLKKLYEEYYEKGDNLKKDFFVSEAEQFYNYLKYGGEKIWGYHYYKDLFDDKIPFKKRSKKKILTIFTSSYYEFYALGIEFRKKKGKDINHYEIIRQILSSPYILENYDINYIRAWHAHKKEEKFFTCVSGSCQISCVQVKNFKQPNKKSKINSWVLTAEKPEIIYVPKSYANGTMNLSHGTKILVFSTSTLRNSLQDDFRYDHKYWDPWEIKKR